MLAKVVNKVKSNWSKLDKSDKILKFFYMKRNELYIENEFVLFGERVIIPTTLRKYVLKMLHDTLYSHWVC